MQAIDVPTGLRALSPLPLVLAAVWAAVGALAARELGVVGCAAAGGAAALACAVGRRAGAAALALPAALGALTIPPAEPEWPPEGPVRVEGVVHGRIARDTVTGSARFEVVPAGGGAPVLCAARLRPGDPFDAVLPGDRVRGTAFLRDVARRREAGLPPVAEVELAALAVEHGGPTPRRLATWTRLRLEEALRRALPDEPGRLCAHLVLGTGPRLPDDLVDAHRATGLAHLLAVSGAHATILAWMLAAAFAGARGRDPWLARGFRRGCGLFLLCYGAITGFEPPVLRALVAWLLVATAIARGRRPTIAAALALPALVTALVAPKDLLSISFCLSYAAVVGLAAAGAFRRPEGLWQHLVQALRASAWATIATAPFALAFFGQLAPWTVLGTPLLAPIVAAMLALGVLTAGLGVLLPALAPLPAAPLGFLAEGYAAAVRTIAELPAAPIHAPLAPPLSVLVAWSLLAVGVLVARPTRRGLLAACVIASLPHFVGPVAEETPRLTLCDVGHGQCAVARLPDGQVAVVDCGNLLDHRRAARAAVQALGSTRRVDLLVVSHGDADHTGGIPSLARRVRIGRALLPHELEGSLLARELTARGTALTFARPGTTLRPFAGLTVHAPAVDRRAPRNERSLWTVVDAGGTRVIVPGDAEERGIRAALRDFLEERCDVLVLPHHGRGPPTSASRLLAKLAPRACLVSTGPGVDPPLVAIARAHGAAVLSTADHGRLVVRLDGSGAVDAERPARVAGARAEDR